MPGYGIAGRKKKEITPYAEENNIYRCKINNIKNNIGDKSLTKK